MKRFDPIQRFDQGGTALGKMVEQPDGDWVRLEDHECEIRFVRIALRCLRIVVESHLQYEELSSMDRQALEVTSAILDGDRAGLRSETAASDGGCVATPGTQIKASYGGGIQVKDMDAHDIADAILRARPKPFMPATRLCTACDTALPDSLPPTIHKCSRCRNEL